MANEQMTYVSANAVKLPLPSSVKTGPEGRAERRAKPGRRPGSPCRGLAGPLSVRVRLVPDYGVCTVS